MGSIRRLIRGEQGQSTAMIVSMLFLLVLFVALVANVGQAVNRRIALQTLADAGAFTGATVMGVAMNQLAYWNQWLQYLWDGYSLIMVSAIEAYFFPVCEWADSITNVYKGAYDGIWVIMSWLNFTYDGLAFGDAGRVTEFNAKDLFPGETLAWGEPGRGFAPTSLAEMPITYSRDWANVVGLENVPDGTKTDTLGLIGSKTHFSYLCFRSCGPFCEYPSWEDKDVDVWKKKKRDDPLIFTWAVRAPAVKAVAFDWLFGPNAIPEMTAVAAAKPIGGNIQHIKQDYVTKLVYVDKVMTGGGSIVDTKYAGWLLRKVLH